MATEKDFLDAVHKVEFYSLSQNILQNMLKKIVSQVIKSYAKFSATPKYMTYNWAGHPPLASEEYPFKYVGREDTSRVSFWNVLTQDLKSV